MSQITTHVLDTARGVPADGIGVALSYRRSDGWATIAAGTTDGNGRVSNLCDRRTPLASGTYLLHFDTAEYFKRTGEAVFYPWAEVAFNIASDGQHYHIPLLLSPHGYSTYRGS